MKNAEQTAWDTLQALADEAAKRNRSANGGVAYPRQGVCPGCGRCGTCGRPHQTQPYPYWPHLGTTGISYF